MPGSGERYVGPDGSCHVAHGTYHDRGSMIYNVKGVHSANLRT